MLSTPSLAIPTRRAFALVLTLSTLGMLVALALALFSIATSSRSTAFTSAKHARVSQLSELATDLTVAQWRAATSGLSTSRTWTSQPGLLRVFATSQDPANPSRAALVAAHKLYSDSPLTHIPASHGPFDPATESAKLASWETQPALFTDLNAPARSSSGAALFPIVDPIASATVDGFSLDPSPGSPATATRPAAMPVRWIYVLEDGQLTLPDGHDPATLTATFSGTHGPVPTRDNPITGRIAFWADDESAKVNVNTASEGVFWDHPMAHTRTERGNANSIVDWPQPPYGFASSLAPRGEFSRYPGHPAQTSLSAVLGQNLPVTQPRPTVPELAAYYQISPRTTLGGTQGGHVLSNQSSFAPRGTDRLYASPHELALRPDRRPATLSNSPAVPAAEVAARSSFFLTAHSRAPEFTVRNQPRIALWPLFQSPSLRNPIDHLIAHCATIARQPFYFQRATRSTGGGGGIYGSGYSATEDLALPRNAQLLAYLDRATSSPLPGFGTTSFQDKYGAPDQRRLLVTLADAIRSNFNTFNRGILPHYEFTSYAQVGEFFIAPATATLSGTTAKGFGLAPTITEAALVFYATQVDPATTVGDGLDERAARATEVQAFLLFETFKSAPGMPHQSPGLRIQVEGLQQFQLDGQPMGFPADASTLIDREQFGGGWGSFCAHSPLLLQFIRHGGYNLSLVSARIPLPSASDTMAFTGGPLTIRLRSHPRTGRSDIYQTLTLDFPNMPNCPRPRARQGDTLPRNFNDRVVAAAGAPDASLVGLDAATADKIHKLNGRARDTRQILIERGDVVRSVEVDPAGPSGGDYRLVAGLQNVPASFFRPHPRYLNTDFASRDAHSLRDDKFSLMGMPGFRTSSDTPPAETLPPDPRRPSNLSHSGRLVAGANYGPLAAPTGAHGLQAALLANGRPGDWETGLSIFPDGAYTRRSYESGSSRRGDSFIRDDSSYYLYGYYYHDSTGIDFAPNRQVASAVLFGSLPTGVFQPRPWQTLLFNPIPPSRQGAPEMSAAIHPGHASPHDHLMLDLFWMPAVEPYAISEPFSTAGKINMNYQMVPFTHIRRTTALHAALKPLRLTAIPAAAAGPEPGRPAYKDLDVCPWEFRYAINPDHVDGTLAGFERRFESGDVFRSASEICEIPLVPQRLSQLPPSTSYPPGVTDPTYDETPAWWQQMALTGDNLREMPYNQLYPRLTTKTSTLTVHHRAQILVAPRGADPATWTEDPAHIIAEHRGATLIERFIDPHDPDLPDYAAPASALLTPEDHAQYRILSRR
jgi:uncharacterized protein (TIGR02600 family)